MILVKSNLVTEMINLDLRKAQDTFTFSSLWRYFPHSIQIKKYCRETYQTETFLNLKMIANTTNGVLITTVYMEESETGGYNRQSDFWQQDRYPQDALARLWISLKKEGKLDLGLLIIQETRHE